LANASQAWLQQWLNQGADGFNPFDVLASHYLISPEDIVSEELNARLEIHPDDTKKDNERNIFKQYLLCDRRPGFPVKYCYGVETDYHDRLLESFL
jgi:pyrimidine-specific ribonucleoside hydrolase